MDATFRKIGKKQRPLKESAPIPDSELKKRSEDSIYEFKPERVRTKIHAQKFKIKKQRFEERVRRKIRAEVLDEDDENTLETDNGLVTYHIQQREIVNSVDIATAGKTFSLDLDHGPYRARYTSNGRHLLLGGKDGHIAAFDWLTKDLHTEFSTAEAVNDVAWLHTETMFAAAQRRWTYVYDQNGSELHCIKSMFDIHSLEFLPKHFLLVGLSNTGYLTYLDVSTGDLVRSWRIKQKSTSCMTQNPANAVILSGNLKGVVSMWSPSQKEPLAELLACPGPITDITVDNTGMYMAVSSMNRTVRIWDLRMYEELHAYQLPRPATSVCFSQQLQMAVSFDRDVHDMTIGVAKKPYMRQLLPSAISSLQFCPYEDVLAVGHRQGFTSLIIPGSADQHFDSLRSNPFESKKQRKEREVRQLMEKLQPEMITLNPSDIARVNQEQLKKNMEHRETVMHWKNVDIDVEPTEPRYYRMIIGRDDEKRKLRGLILPSLQVACHTPLSIYVSGVPGTGKTATVQYVIHELLKKKDEHSKKAFRYIYINCVGVKTKMDFYREMSMHICPKKSAASLSALEIECLDKLFKQKSVLVLDEIDFVVNLKDRNRFAKHLFSWPIESKGNIILIGIANQLDLSTKLPKSAAPPENIIFKPYSSAELQQIIRTKLLTDETESKAVELCARKVSTMTGDVRRALALAQTMIISMRPPAEEERNENIHTPKKKSRIYDAETLTPTGTSFRPAAANSPRTPSTPRTPISVCRDVLGSLNKLYSSPAVRSNQIPLLPRIVLACIIRLSTVSMERSKRPLITRSQLLCFYERAAKRIHSEVLTTEQISSALTFLETEGLISVKRTGIFVEVDVQTARTVIADSEIITAIDDVPVKT